MERGTREPMGKNMYGVKRVDAGSSTPVFFAIELAVGWDVLGKTS